MTGAILSLGAFGVQVIMPIGNEAWLRTQTVLALMSPRSTKLRPKKRDQGAP
jgi:hypothetical protein